MKGSIVNIDLETQYKNKPGGLINYLRKGVSGLYLCVCVCVCVCARVRECLSVQLCMPVNVHV